jgi:hypothetical protein
MAIRKIYMVLIVLLGVCIFGAAVATTIVLVLKNVYKPNQATCKNLKIICILHFFFCLASVCQISFASMISVATGTGPMAVKVADLNNDSFLDIVVANYDGGTASILFGYGNGSFQPYVDLSNDINAQPTAIVIGDINKDNRLDILIANRNASNVGVFLGQGNGTFSQQIIVSTGTNSTPTGLALSDLNSDTILDIVVANHQNDNLVILLGIGNGTFTNTLTLQTGNYSGPYLVIVNDFNKDGYLDIAAGCGDANYVGIFLGDGTGKFSNQTVYYIESGPYALAATDFNRDGILDIVTANYDSNSTSVLFGNGNGTFRLSEFFSTGNGSLPYAIVISDFNRDNIPDLIVPNSGTDNVGILLGYGNGTFMNQTTYSTGNNSYPVDVTVGDINGDNRLDIISANNKLNTVGIFLSTCS